MNADTGKRPIHGTLELDNGIILDWLRFAHSEEEAVRIVKAQHVHVKRCKPLLVPAPTF